MIFYFMRIEYFSRLYPLFEKFSGKPLYFNIQKHCCKQLLQQTTSYTLE